MLTMTSGGKHSTIGPCWQQENEIMSQRHSMLYRGRHSIVSYYFSVICKDAKSSTDDWIGFRGNRQSGKAKLERSICVYGPEVPKYPFCFSCIE